MATRREPLSALTALAVALGCGACTDQPCAAEFPADAPAQGRFVAAGCAYADADGSRDKPYATIAAALQGATTGTVVVLAAGTYRGTHQLPAGAELHGAGPDKVVLEGSGTGPVVRLSGAGAATLRGLSVRSGAGVGVQSEGVALAMVHVAVSKTTATANGPGHGVQVVGASSLTLEGCTIEHNAGVGVLAKGVALTSIVDPAFSRSPRMTGDTAAIVDPAFLPQSVIADNGGGGVAIVDPAFAPGKSDGATSTPALHMQTTAVRGNAVFGVALYGAGAFLERSAIFGTTAKTGGDVADGLIVAAGTTAPGAQAALVELDPATVIASNGRVGVLVATGQPVELQGELADNAFGGAWAQGAGAELRLGDKARVRRNSLAGVAVTLGARLVGTGCRIEQTKARPWADPAGGVPSDVGDGVGVFQGASAALQAAVLDGNARAGLMIHAAKLDSKGAPEVVVQGVTFRGGAFGVAINKQDAGAGVDWKTGNTFDKVAQDVEPAGQLTVRTQLCGAKASNTGCVAAP